MNNVRACLERSGLSQAELARRTGLGEKRVSYILRGRQRVTEDNAAQIADVLGCLIDELIRPVPPTVRDAAQIAADLTPADAETWLAIGRRLQSQND